MESGMMLYGATCSQEKIFHWSNFTIDLEINGSRSSSSRMRWEPTWPMHVQRVTTPNPRPTDHSTEIDGKRQNGKLSGWGSNLGLREDQRRCGSGTRRRRRWGFLYCTTAPTCSGGPVCSLEQVEMRGTTIVAGPRLDGNGAGNSPIYDGRDGGGGALLRCRVRV